MVWDTVLISALYPHVSRQLGFGKQIQVASSPRAVVSKKYSGRWERCVKGGRSKGTSRGNLERRTRSAVCGGRRREKVKKKRFAETEDWLF